MTNCEFNLRRGAMNLTTTDFGYLGRYLEGFFFGLYSGIFAMYLRYQALKNDTDRTRNILFYALSSLYILSVATIVLDVVDALPHAENADSYMITISSIIFGCCDFISQSILIYRCWIVWGRNIRVVIIPSILAFTFLATWLTALFSSSISSDYVFSQVWEHKMLLTGFAISMTVNALVMGLIVLKIFKVFREVLKATSGEQNLGATGGSKLRSIIFILIESGTALFSIQLARLMVNIILPPDATSAYNFVVLIAGIQQMLNGITPTIILVRVSMKLSFHDESSLVEATTSLCFAPDHPNPNLETGSISIGRREREDDVTGIRQIDSDEIEMVDRQTHRVNT